MALRPVLDGASEVAGFECAQGRPILARGAGGHAMRELLEGDGWLAAFAPRRLPQETPPDKSHVMVLS